MKKMLAFILLFIYFNNIQAQYKRASFLTKKGRTYDLGLTSRLLGGGNSPTLGFRVSYGKERSNKRLFHWWDLEFTLGNKYKYNTTGYVNAGIDYPEKPVLASGKTQSNFAWKYNLAYFLVDNRNKDKKILPFVDLSAGMVLPFNTSVEFTTNPTRASGLKKQVLNGMIVYIAGIGSGVIYKMNDRFGVKFNAVYYAVLINKTKLDSHFSYFKTLPNHVGISIGAHWLLDRDN